MDGIHSGVAAKSELGLGSRKVHKSRNRPFIEQLLAPRAQFFCLGLHFSQPFPPGLPVGDDLFMPGFQLGFHLLLIRL